MEQQPSNDPRAGDGDWRAAARAAVAHLQDKDVPANVASALRSLAAALAPPGKIPDVVWPLLTEKALVHGTVFEPGTSTKPVVEEAVRYYLFEQQPPRVASRASVLDRFGAQVGALVTRKDDSNDQV